MTYSHNSVSKNLKMASAATAAAAASIRLKNGAGEAGKVRGSGGGNSPPSTPIFCAHSNSIACNSTNYPFHQPSLSSSPPGCSMSSAMSTSSNSSSSSSVSSIASSNNGSSRSDNFFSMRKQQRQHYQQQQQRRSPQQQHSDSGSYFNNMNNQQSGSGLKRISGSGVSSQKHRDGIQRSPQNYHQSARQSPASILGGGISISPTNSISGGNNSTRKPRSKHSSPLLCVGGDKMSPTHPLIPTALTHFAGSKCFDAPAPNALPKPPEHWTGTKCAEKATSSAGPGLQGVLSAAAARTHHQHHHHGSAHDSRSYGGHVVKTSKRNLLDEFNTHTLKLLLNVQS